jgi:hypothetical protein
LNVTLDYIVVEKYRAMAATIVTNLKKRFWVSTILVNNQREKMQEGQKEHDLALTQLEVVNVDV